MNGGKGLEKLDKMIIFFFFKEKKEKKEGIEQKNYNLNKSD